jgi:predicted transcriptional regulator
MSAILLSINPEHLDKIFEGTKTYEFRKVCCKKEVSRIVFYCTYPVMKVLGEAEVDDILEEHPAYLWAMTSIGAGISKTFFDEYYNGRSKGVAFSLKNVTKFEDERELSDYDISAAPQSFTYL